MELGMVGACQDANAVVSVSACVVDGIRTMIHKKSHIWAIEVHVRCVCVLQMQTDVGHPVSYIAGILDLDLYADDDDNEDHEVMSEQ